MNFLKPIGKLMFAAILLICVNNSAKAQTTLVPGDIAFTGYFGNGATALNDQFSFVLLTNITTGTVINFTDNAWFRTAATFRAGEGTATFTSTGAIASGTEILITITSTTTATATLVGGGAAPATVTGALMPALSANGDQILAYQGLSTSPTFISAIHMNVYSVATILPDIPGGDNVTTNTTVWEGDENTTNACGLPTTLTNGVNAIWIPGSIIAEKDNAKFNCAGPLGTAAQIRAAVNNVANWITSDGDPAPTTLPTGCSYITAIPAPSFTTNPGSITICEGTGTTFTVAATGATSYQWQVDAGSGFGNITNNATYSGATTTSLTVTGVTNAMNGYLYRAVATNGTGSTNSTNATLTVTALPLNPTILAKTPVTGTVADGTNVNATFNAGSGGTTCTDDFRYSINGGASYLPYTPGTNISTTGIAAGSGFVFIEGRRAACASACQNNYVVLASWIVSPLPAGVTTLAAGDIAFSGYIGGNNVAADEFSFVLLKNMGAGTVINFTTTGWLGAAFRTAEETVAWTVPAGGLSAGTEIKIAGLVVTRSGPGAAGSVTGTALGCSVNGDQILAYTGTAGAPTFISAIHMNVYRVADGDAVTTSAAVWDGAIDNINASALPTGLTTGTNAIWIGNNATSGTEFDNAKFGNCSNPAVPGSITALRAALNNQANWITSDGGDPASFTLPTGCNYLSVLCPTITVTNPGTTTGTTGAAFSQTFTSAGGAPTVTYTTSSTLPSGLTLSSAGVLSGTPTQSGTFPIIVVATDANGCTGTSSTYSLVISCAVVTAPTITPGGPTTFCAGGSVTLTSSVATGNQWYLNGGPIGGAVNQTYIATASGSYTVVETIAGPCSSGPSSAVTVTVNPGPATPTITPGGPTTFCAGGSVTLTSSSATGNQWYLNGNPIGGAVNQTYIATASGNYTVDVLGGGCTSAPSAATAVTVNPIPDATATPASQTRCSGTAIGAIVLSGTVGGTTFNWTRDNTVTVTGIAASGSGNITGALTNTTTTPITVTFTITPDAAGCGGTPITATVVVNPTPPSTITGGNVTVCATGTTLSAPVDPNYTYAWSRSLTGAPFTSIGSLQTQNITASGNYQLTVTNQYTCSSNSTTTVNVADFVFNGSIGAGDAQQTGRLNRFGVVSTCAAAKACPGAFTTTGLRFYDSYTITNVRNTPVCATIGINSACATNVFSVAYLGSFNPASLCTNYLADPGSSFPASGFYEATIPANGTIVVIVHEVNTGAGCGSYSLTVDVPREAAGITASPSATVCSGIPVTFTASTANTYLWTPNGETTQTISPVAATTYGVTLGYGNNGCTATASQALTVNPTPTVNTVIDQGACNGGTFNLAFTGAVPGTTYNWTNSNTAIGLGASGSGDLNFVATNATASPISGTITVTPVIGSCTGTPITFTITVAIQPVITSVTGDQVCATGGTANLSATGNGNIHWYDALTGGNQVHSGTTYSPTVSGTTTFYVESAVLPVPPQAITMPAQTSTFPGNTRGYVFTAPTSFVITSLHVPTTASSGSQSVAVVKFNGNVPPPVFSASTNAFTILFVTQQSSTGGTISVNIPIQAGEVIGILGSRGNINSYGPTGSSITINGNTVGITRLGMQFLLSNTAPRDLWQEPGGFISRVEFEYAPAVCTSSPRVPVTATANLLPAVTCPADITQNNTTNQCGAIATYSTTVTGIPAPTETYAFTGATTASGSGNGSGSFFNVGITTVTVTVTNSCGTATCSFTVTINDTQAPVLTCPAPTTVSCASAVPAADIASVTGVSDNCGGPLSVTHIGDVISNQTCANRFTVTRTYRVTDAAGNFTECTQIITVNDVTAPVLTCPAPVTVSCASAVPAANIADVTGVSDNCAGVVTVTHIGDVISNQTCTNRFTITRTYRATDVCGNFAECTQIITVNDVTPPVLTCPAPVTVSCASAVPAANIAAVTGVSDNCAGAVTVTHIGDVISNQTCANRFTITRTYRATDVCGNFAECTQIITVNDVTPPVLTCPAPVTVSCASAVPVANIASVTGVSDNCGGVVTITHVGDVISNQTCANRYTITRTYRATDVCGNFTNCTQIITVNDQTAPVITCSPNLTAVTPIGSCTAIVPFTVTATDNCGGAVTIVSVPASGSAFPIGTTTVTSTATDACGNSSSCTFTVTVTDGQLPVITTQPANRTVCTGSNATFSVVATNAVTYQWQQWNGTAWVNLPAANASSFTLNGVTIAQNTNTYRVVITGLCTVVNSGAATLYVNPLPTISLVASGSPVLLPTEAVTITAVTSPAGGTFVWFKNGVAIPGITGAVLSNLRVNDAGTYRAVYTDPNGCVSTSADIIVSAEISDLLYVYPNPNKGVFSVRFYNQPNEKVTLSVYDSKGARVYQKTAVTNLAYTVIDADISRHATGIYLVEVRNASGRLIGAKRIIVGH